MAGQGNRPLSPHLGVWKWGPAMAVSILHRISGDGLAIVGASLLVWWLYSISGGPESYELFVTCMTSVPGYIVLIGISWAIFQHMFSGIRHLIMDMGAGFELKTNAMWSILVPVLAITATAGLWVFIFTKNFG